MKKKDSFVLYIKDEEIRVYKGGNCLHHMTNKDFRSALPFLEEYSLQNSTVYLIIDIQQQDILEERLPPLFPWDYLYFIFHKRETYLTLGGGYIGFSFFRQDKKSYLRTIHIPPPHPFYEWIAWIRTGSGKVFFLPLETEKLLKAYSNNSTPYKMVSYSLENGQVQQIIFKEKRLLLSRLCRGQDDQKSSLHFLSRNFPDINEKIDTTDCSLNEVIDFIIHKNRPSLFLIQIPFKKEFFYLILKIFFVISIILWTVIEIYYGSIFKDMTETSLRDITILERASDAIKTKLSGKNIPFLRKAVAHYAHVTAATKSPLQDLITVEKVLRDKNLSLQEVIWKRTTGTEIIVTFLLKPASLSILAHSFENTLFSFQTFFPSGCIQTLTGPYKSAPHEAFLKTKSKASPLASIKIILP